MTKRKRLNAVRKSGKSQAKKQLIDSSNGVNQNNHNINEECAQFGVGMKILLALFLTSSILMLHCFLILNSLY